MITNVLTYWMTVEIQKLSKSNINNKYTIMNIVCLIFN